jgi:ubiquinone biosynthesis protein UbiJ
LINKYDAQEIATQITDIYRTKLAQRRVDVTAEELDAVRNFVFESLSNKVDNSMIQNTQYDPRAARLVNVEE